MKKIFAFIIFLLAFTTINAQIDMEIGNGITVETTGGVSIELSGNLFENGTGYLNGVVTTGDRGADVVSSFAGLDLTTGAVNKITRTTGSAYSTSNPKTSFRSYELDNNTAFTANVTSTYIESGTNDERNSIDTPFLYKKVGSTWTGYDDNSTTANSVGASSVSIPTGISNLVISEGIGVGAKIFLEGPYTSNAMSTTLHSSLPLASPYTLASRSAAAIPPSAVDWVMLELRTGPSATSVVSRRSVFVKSTGEIIKDTGTVGTSIAATPGSYYLVVKHRNHLSVMSPTAINGFNWVSTP